MDKKLYIAAACLLHLLFSGCSRQAYDPIPYRDITAVAQYGTDEYEDGSIIIYYINGHRQDDMTVIFKSYLPYKSVEMRGNDEAFFITYIEQPEGEKTDIIFHIDGFYAQNGFYDKEIGDNLFIAANSAIHITVNGKRINHSNIHVFWGIE